jgi:hypothetical protein
VGRLLAVSHRLHALRAALISSLPRALSVSSSPRRKQSHTPRTLYLIIVVWPLRLECGQVISFHRPFTGASSRGSPWSGWGRVLGLSRPVAGAGLGRCEGLGRLVLVRPATGAAGGWVLPGGGPLWARGVAEFVG